MSAWLYSWRWPIWFLYVAAWTAALLMPVAEAWHWNLEDLQINVRFLFAKGVHVSAYVLFAVLTAWLRAPMRYRFGLMFLVMAHATVTEVLQHSIEFIGRSGTLLDVALDHTGIALGTAAAWKWWTSD